MKKHEDGSKPLNRPRDWQAEESKKHNWSANIPPIIVPATPDSELFKMLKEVVETEAVNGLRFKDGEACRPAVKPNRLQGQRMCGLSEGKFPFVEIF